MIWGKAGIGKSSIEMKNRMQKEKGCFLIGLW
jgi:hypothetical protein